MTTVQKRIEFLVNFGGKTHVISERDALQMAFDIVNEFMRDKDGDNILAEMQERLDDLEYIATGRVAREEEQQEPEAKSMAFPYFKWYPGDYARDTAHLSMEQDGAYRRLIDAYMSRGKAPHGDAIAIYRICGAVTPDEQSSVDFILREYFQRVNGEWRNSRCDLELANQRKQSRDKSKAAHVRHGHDPDAYADAGADAYAGAGADAGATAYAAAGILDNQIPEPEPELEPKSKTKAESKPKAQNAAKKSSPLLPDWLPPDAWRQFQEHRIALRAKMTANAERLMILKLDKLRNGLDPTKFIEQSIERGWKGLFEINDNGGSHGRLETKQDRRAATIDALTGGFTIKKGFAKK